MGVLGNDCNAEGCWMVGRAAVTAGVAVVALDFPVGMESATHCFLQVSAERTDKHPYGSAGNTDHTEQMSTTTSRVGKPALDYCRGRKRE